jgi:TP901 family phage tail tape measure protein
MPLGVREVLFIMRARDEASRTITNLGSVFGQVGTRAQELGGRLVGIGSAMSGIGLGMAGVGALGLAAFNRMADAAIEYRQQAALTLTQVDGFKASLRDIERIGLDVAKAIPAPLEELQPALFDIFSSMDVGITSAEKLLKGFAKSAVAGQVDVQTAGRATIAIMNGFKIPVSEVNRVLDVQFQLVRKGVGTYEEFARTIGLSIPSAVRAGQSIQTLAGMLAFLTRNGLSASRASTSAARALDSMSNPVVIQRMEAMGISVRDAAGEFRPMVDIVGQLSDKLKGMTAPERAAALKDLFLGAGGTIQARRFWDLAVTNFAELERLVISMGEGHAAGALQKAYDIMFEQPQSQVQLFQNRIKALEIEIGEGLIPIKMQLLEVGTKLLGLWDKLPDPVQKLIVVAGLLTAALLLLGGTVIAVTGSLTALYGMFVLMGGTAIVGTIGSLFATSTAMTSLGVVAINAAEAVGGFFSTVFLGGGTVGALLPVLGLATLEFAGLFLGVGLVSYGITKLLQHFGLISDTIDPVEAKVRKLTSAFAKDAIQKEGLVAGYLKISEQYDRIGNDLKAYNRLLDASRGYQEQVQKGTKDSSVLHDEYSSALRKVTKAYDELTPAQKKVVGSFSDVKAGLLEMDSLTSAARGRIRELGLQHQNYGEILDKLEPKYRKEIEKIQEANAATDNYASRLGVTLPGALDLSAQASKAFQKELSITTNLIGSQAASMAVYFLAIENEGTDLVNVLARINESSTAFAKALRGSVAEFTDVWAHFGDQTEVGVAEMHDFFVKSREDAITWMGDVQRIIGMGVDRGIVQQLAEAGPKSEPAVQAFIAMVELYGVDFVNNWQRDMDAAAAATEVAFTQMEIAGAIHSAELAAVSTAAMADLKEGGTRNLTALATQGGGAFRALAYDAAVQLARIRADAGIPPPPVVLTLNNWQAMTAIESTRQSLIALTGTVWTVPVRAGALTPTQAAQAAGVLQHGGPVPGPPGAPVPILAHGGEYMLSADVVSRIKRGVYSEGARMGPGAAVMQGRGETYAPITVNAHTDADPYEIGRELAWVQATNPWATPSKVQ